MVGTSLPSSSIWGCITFSLRGAQQLRDAGARRGGAVELFACGTDGPVPGRLPPSLPPYHPQNASTQAHTPPRLRSLADN